MTSEVIALWKQCTEDFHSENYDSCLESLEHLRLYDVPQSKIESNRAVMKYRQALLSIEQYCSCVLELSGASSSANRIIVVDGDQSAMAVNLAFANFSLGRFEQSLSILERFVNEQTDGNIVVMLNAALLGATVCLFLLRTRSADNYLSHAEQLISKAKESKDELPSSVFETYVTHLAVIWMCSYLNALQQYKANEIKSACTTIVSMSEELKHCRASHGLNDFDCITSNTLGCFYSAMNKPNLAATYFQRSLGFSCAPSTAASSSTKLSRRRLFNGMQITYNLAVSLLRAGMYEVALQHLGQVARVFPNDPLVWLHIAECCIYANTVSNESFCNTSECCKKLVKGVVGSGQCRKLLINTMNPAPVKEKQPQSYGQQPELSLDFAFMALQNATLVLDNSTVNQALNDQKRPTEFSGLHAFSDRDRATIGQAILCQTSYVCLCLSKYRLAYDNALKLLELPYLTPQYRYLGNMYAAEASSKMAEFQEAMAYLEQGRCTENATEFDECVKALPNWYPNSSKVANAAVIYNQCLMYSMQQKTDEACMKLSQLSPNEGRLPVQVMLLGICLQIQQGRTDKVKALLERLTPEIGMKPQQLPQVPPPQ